MKTTQNPDRSIRSRRRDRPIQLELDGIGSTHPLLAAGHVDPRFILSDETCRIGRKYLAEMRRILGESAERPAA